MVKYSGNSQKYHYMKKMNENLSKILCYIKFLQILPNTQQEKSKDKEFYNDLLQKRRDP